MSLSYALALGLHLLAAAFWVGGMATMHYAVRPAAAQTLEPPLRLPLMAAALERFLAGVAVAIVVILVSGAVLIVLAGKAAQLPVHVHAMLALGLLMTAVFLYVRFAPFVRLVRAVHARAWPQAAAQLASIRRLVALNLGLGIGVYAVATVGRLW